MLSLRAYSKLSPAPGLEEPVGVHALGDQDVGYQTGQPSREPPPIIVNGIEGEGEHTDAIGAVQQRDEEPHPVVLWPLDRHVRPKGTAGPRLVDRLRCPHQQTCP